MRGEYFAGFASGILGRELPPRARRIQLPKIEGFAHVGTTSACAENTSGDTSDRSNNRNYLRVRGEYQLHDAQERMGEELPPRARRIP